MARIEISWHSEVVGFMEDPVPDMWYLEGKWVPNAHGTNVQAFVEAAKDLTYDECMRSGEGIIVGLKVENGQPIMGLVMAPVGETIFVRRVFDKAAQEMLRSKERTG